jgi:hypothetical protein
MDVDPARIFQALTVSYFAVEGSMCDLRVLCQTTQCSQDAIVVAQRGGVQPDEWTRVLVRGNGRACWYVTWSISCL